MQSNGNGYFRSNRATRYANVKPRLPRRKRACVRKEKEEASLTHVCVRWSVNAYKKDHHISRGHQFSSEIRSRCLNLVQTSSNNISMNLVRKQLLLSHVNAVTVLIFGQEGLIFYPDGPIRIKVNGSDRVICGVMHVKACTIIMLSVHILRPLPLRRRP